MRLLMRYVRGKKKGGKLLKELLVEVKVIGWRLLM